MFPPSKLDIALTPAVQAWMEKIERVVWLHGFSFGIMAGTLVMMLVLVVLLWIRKP